MNIAVLHKIINWILRFLKLQLFISLLAMPILLWWGLPLSILSPIGNLIFGPALTLFLILSSLFFFTELLHIPNGLIASCLDKFTQAWLYLIQSDNHKWLFGFAKPSLCFLIFIPCMAMLILHFKKFKYTAQSVACFTLLLVGSCLYIKTVNTKTNSIQTMPCNRGQLTLLHDKKKLIVIDPGVIGQRISAASWIEYTFAPQLIQTSGKTTIDSLILLQPSAMLFQAIEMLVTKIKVKEIYLIYWQGSLEKREWSRFFGMKNALEAQGVKVHRITNKKITLALSDKSHVVIEPLPEMITYKEIKFPAVVVQGNIDDTPFHVQSHKCKTRTSVRND